MVKFAVSLLIAAALAGPAFANVASSDEFITRDVAEQDLFGRAAVDVVNDLFTREEINDIFGRDVEELDARDLEELYEREIEVSDEMFTRELEEIEARGLFTKFKDWITGKNKKKAAEKKKKEEEKKKAAEKKKEEEEAAEAREFIEVDSLEARDNIFQKFINLFRDKNPAKPAAGAPPAVPATGAAAPPAEAPAAAEAEAPAERDFDDSDLFEREIELLEEPISRSLDEDFDEMVERDIGDGELYERDFDDIELLERDLDEVELLERDLDEELFEREIEFDELD